MKRVRRQREAVQAIRDLGGWVHYDYQMAAFQTGQARTFAFAPDAKPWVPEWLLSHLGEDFFFNVLEVHVERDTEPNGPKNNASEPTGILPQVLRACPHLYRLDIQGIRPTDDDMRIVGALQELEYLYFWDAENITNAGVSCLSRLLRLRDIGLSMSQIDDAGLRVLSSLPNLEGITVQGGRFTDRGLEAVKDKKQLRRLWVGIGPTSITDAGLRHLSGLTNLEELDLSKTAVTDEGLARLKGLTKLKVLLLNNTQITDAGLKYLYDLRSLKDLWLVGTRATGVDFKKAVPKCRIIL